MLNFSKNRRFTHNNNQQAKLLLDFSFLSIQGRNCHYDPDGSGGNVPEICHCEFSFLGNEAIPRGDGLILTGLFRRCAPRGTSRFIRAMTAFF